MKVFKSIFRTEMKEAWFSKAITSVGLTGALSVPSQMPKYGFRSLVIVSQDKKSGHKIHCWALCENLNSSEKSFGEKHHT